jgi:hypothetical protein
MVRTTSLNSCSLSVCEDEKHDIDNVEIRGIDASDSFVVSNTSEIASLSASNENSTSVTVNKVCRMIPIMWSSSLTYTGVLALREINEHFKYVKNDGETPSLSKYGEICF